MLDFLIAGAQKAGTTALWHFLRQHPQIHMPEKKELHFFDNENIDWLNPPYNQIHGEFGHVAAGQICGEATPIYTYWLPSMPRIRAYNPDMKLIVILRDPVMRAFSHWRMETARGNETMAFSNAIREGRRRVAKLGKFGGCHRVFSYVERGFYFGQLSRMLDLFCREQILIIRQSDLQANRDQVLDGICRFLGVAPFDTYPRDEIVFSHADRGSSELADCDITYLRSLFSADMANLARDFGIAIEPEVLPRFRQEICHADEPAKGTQSGQYRCKSIELVCPNSYFRPAGLDGLVL